MQGALYAIVRPFFLLYRWISQKWLKTPLFRLVCIRCRWMPIPSFNKPSSVLDMRVSWAKTKLQNIGSGGHTSNITVNGNTVEQVDNIIRIPRQYPFTGDSQADITRRIAHCTCVIGHVFSATSLDGSTTLVINEDPGRPIWNPCLTRSLVYACETWTVLATDERRLEVFHMKCQRQISKIRWQDHIRNSEVAARTGLGLVSDPIQESLANAKVSAQQQCVHEGPSRTNIRQMNVRNTL